MNDDYDTPWKDVITDHFPEFMAFYFPEADGPLPAWHCWPTTVVPGVQQSLAGAYWAR